MIIQDIKKICKIYNIWPSQENGQNFVISQQVIQVIESASLKPADCVLEVGPGLGFLTQQLIKVAKRVVSVELDKQIFSFLTGQFLVEKNLELINQDILKFNPASIDLKKYKIVANLPYNITSFFLRRFLNLDDYKPTAMTLMLQKEVAERICAKPGAMSLLAISVQVFCQPEITYMVSKNDFWPQPKVNSAIINFNLIKTNQEFKKWLGQINDSFFWRIIKIGFSARRKQLHNNLSAGLKIDSQQIKKIFISLNLAENIRPQDLSIDDWLKLCINLENI